MNYQNVANFEDFFATKHYLGTNQWHWISKEIASSILHLCLLRSDLVKRRLNHRILFLGGFSLKFIEIRLSLPVIFIFQ